MIQARIDDFLIELSSYIGHDYLSHEQIVLGDDTRFDQLKFDLVDEVITELFVQRHFDLHGWTCDIWPDTIGALLDMVREASNGA